MTSASMAHRRFAAKFCQFSLLSGLRGRAQTLSAIGAIFSAEGVPDSGLELMAQTLAQIPHDQRGTWSAGPMAIAAAVLHTTLESRERRQPHTSEDQKVAIAFDGHLLNPEELSADLKAKGAVLRDGSDAEIALRAYEQWGEDFAVRLQGEFALIIADNRKGRLVAARDHLGFVPLYYRIENNRLIIASDFRTLSALSRTPMTPNPRYLAQIICNRWYLREETPWKEASRLVRAHTLSFDGERLTTQRYWVPPTDIVIRYKRDEEYVEHYRELLFDCVRRSSRADRSVGIAVSGGLDSSALFSVADRLEKQGKWQAPGLAGYSLAAAEDGNAFELPYARAAAAHLGRDLTEVPLFDPDIEWYTRDGDWHRDIPTPSNGAMMLDMEQRVLDDGSRVLINGIGGDEWLQGNSQYYREYIMDRDVGRFARALSHDAESTGWPSALKKALRQAGAQFAPQDLRAMVRRRLRETRRRNDRALTWLAPELRQALKEAEEQFEAELPENGVLWAKHNLATSPFSDLTHSLMRRQRSKIGLESRHPMLSRPFMEFSLQTPADIKRRGEVSKVIHRKAMQGIVSPTVLERQSKANFTNAKIDAQYAGYVRQHASERLAEICDLEGLEWLLKIDFSQPEGDYWAWEIWGLYASAAFLYQDQRVTDFNPATGVQQDRK